MHELYFLHLIRLFCLLEHRKELVQEPITASKSVTMGIFITANVYSRCKRRISFCEITTEVYKTCESDPCILLLVLPVTHPIKAKMLAAWSVAFVQVQLFCLFWNFLSKTGHTDEKLFESQKKKTCRT